MSALAKRSLIWLLLVAVCIQGTAAVTAALRGPSHHHTAIEAASTPPARDVGAMNHSHQARHSHDEVRRHYHLPGEGADLVQDHSHDDPVTAAERTSRDKPVSAPFVAVTSDFSMLTPNEEASGIAIGPAKKLLSCTPRRIERPPRPLSA